MRGLTVIEQNRIFHILCSANVSNVGPTALEETLEPFLFGVPICHIFRYARAT